MAKYLTGLAALIALGVFSHSGGQGLLALALGSLSRRIFVTCHLYRSRRRSTIGWIIFSEDLSFIQFAGALLILTGIAIARPRGSEQIYLASQQTGFDGDFVDTHQ